MKTHTLMNKTTRNLTLAVLMVLTINVFADGDRKSTCSKAKSSNTELKNLTATDMMTASLMSPAPMLKAWEIVEFEEELEVLDLELVKEMKPAWNFEVYEFELEVEEFKPTEELIPSWMIIDVEPELEVSDLVIK